MRQQKGATADVLDTQFWLQLFQMGCCGSTRKVARGRYHGGRRPSSEDSFHSPTVIPPSALDKPSNMKRYHRRPKCSHTSPRRSPTMVFSFSFSFSSRWHRSARKGPYALRPVSQQSPQGCPRNSANICLVEHRSFSAFEGGMSAASFLHSSFLQAVSAVMLWLVRAEKVPQASEHLCPAKLQTRCDICCACQSICPFIPTDSGVPRTVDPQKSL